MQNASQAYVDRLVEDNGQAKVLLLDTETTAVLSLAATQSRLLRRDVFMIDKIENMQRQKMRHLDCTVFVSPTSSSIAALLEELRDPKYKRYSLIFSNLLRKSQLERLAEADDYACVDRVQEMLLDWLSVNGDVFNCGVQHVYTGFKEGSSAISSNQRSVQIQLRWDTVGLEKSCSSLLSVIASLRLRPQIRYDQNSGLSRQLAVRMQEELQQNSGFLPQSTQRSLVLVLDRLNDPVTPLISHWTYQAMVDELLGLRNNRVDLHDAVDVPESHKEIVLSADQDSFFEKAMFLNFGDLGASVRDYVQQYSSKSKSSEQLETVADIKRFVEMLPDFRKLQSNTTKHVSLVGELSRLVSEQQLLQVSEVEQSLACTENHTQGLQSVRTLVQTPDLWPVLKYRVVCLYGLRYKQHPQQQTAELLQALQIQFGDTHELRAVERILRVFKDGKYPQEDLFKQHSIFDRAQQGLKELRGVENVYTQHKSLLESILAQLVKTKLPVDKYPYLRPPSSEQEVQTVVVFIVGGATYEEARVVGEFNRLGQYPKIVLGGTDMVNPKRFLDAFSE